VRTGSGVKFALAGAAQDQAVGIGGWQIVESELTPVHIRKSRYRAAFRSGGTYTPTQAASTAAIMS